MKRIITIVGIVLGLIVLIIAPLFIRVKIDCKSQYGNCPEEILGRLKPFSDKNLLTAKRGVKKILKSDFLISDYSIQFKIPNILHVELLVKKAVIALKNNKSDALILIDKDGKVLSVSESTALPTITTDKDLSGVGQNIDESDLSALKLASGIYQMYQVGQSTVQDGSLLVELPGQIRVIFPLDGDSEILLSSLRLIYSKVREDGNLAGYSQIDLRYKNPVLR